VTAGKWPQLQSYVILVAVLGAVILITAWLPLILRRLPLTLPIACIAFGVLLALSPLSTIISANPLANRLLTERLTEFAVIISLMGAGLKLDRPLGLAGWAVTWRLLAIAMPLTIALIAALAWGILGMSLASAILLGAALAPTDPVLASDVQVGPPNSAEEDEVRFALTSEAGLNDGLSFPFVYLAIALALSQESGTSWFGDWVAFDVVWKLASGLLIGWLTGSILGHLTFRVSKKTQISKTNDGMVAIGITLLCYGLTELAHGYGFIAVFVAAVTLRSVERRHSYHQELHAFTEQIERLCMMAILVCFGAAIAEGSIFGSLSWEVVVVGLLIIFAIRPISGLISLSGFPQKWEEKSAIAFFGIRGLGSFYYLAFALGKAEFDHVEILWVTLCFTVLVSIILHGATVTPVMRFVDHKRWSSRR
jgi:sodium/hydrogen antiporter